MSKILELYWDFSSPFAYLGASQAESIAARTGAQLVWHPMLLGGLFKGLGQVEVPLLSWSEPKRDYVFKDLHDWADFHGVPFKFTSHFPLRSIKALRCYLALPEERRNDFRDKVFRAAWAEDRDIADDAVLHELIGDDGDQILAKTQDPAIKQALMTSTQSAAERGVFGAPTWFVRQNPSDAGKMFWGQDRIPVIERALSLG